MTTPHNDNRRQSLNDAKTKLRGDINFDDVMQICLRELKHWQDGTDGYRTEIWQFLRAAADRAKNLVISKPK
jgi:hypothetical protein